MRSLRRGQALAAGLLLAVAPLAATMATALPAGATAAHGGGGQISLVRAEATGPDTVAVEVCVTFTLDRDQADTARVTLAATGPGELSVPAETMEVGDQPGLRSGELTLPEEGSWTVQVSSTFPPAELAVPVTVDGQQPQAGATAGPVGGGLAPSCEAEGGPGVPTWLVAGLGTAAAVVVFGGLLLLLRRAATPADPPAEATPAGDEPSLRPQRHQRS